jgi:hypothetical protein
MRGLFREEYLCDRHPNKHLTDFAALTFLVSEETTPADDLSNLRHHLGESRERENWGQATNLDKSPLTN